MKNRSYMLPYYYKKVGWIMLVCTPVFFLLGLLAFRWELIANVYDALCRHVYGCSLRRERRR